MHILVAIKPQLAIGNTLISAIRDSGYVPVVVNDGYEAWEQLQKIHTSAVVIVQDDLPHVRGGELCSRLHRSLKNIFYTILIVEDYSFVAASRYVDDYMSKTITPVEVNVKINCALNNLQRYKDIFQQTQPTFGNEILIVEDDDISRTVVSGLVEKLGYRSLEAADGEKALAFFDAQRFPRIVILDWMMPRISGIDVCKKIREMEDKAPIYIIFLTAKSTPDNVKDGFAEGADDYLTKPFSASELNARIEVGVRYINVQLQIRKRARDAEVNYEYILQNSPQGIFRADVHGELLLVNPAFAKICGYFTPEEMKSAIKYVDEVYEDRQHFSNVVKKLQSNISVTEETKILYHGNQERWVLEQLTLNNSEGEQYVDGFVQDISERKKSEIQLQILNQNLEERIEERTKEVEKAREFFHLILDTLPANVAVLNAEGVIIFVNKAWRNFGDRNGLRTPRHCLESNYVNVCLNAQGADKKQAHEVGGKLQQILQGNLIEFSYEYPCHGPLEKRWFNAHVVRFYFYGQVHIVIAHENITKLKLIEQESLKARDEARIANESKSQFLANMSHEIRTPLNAIIGINTLLKNTDLTAKQIDYVHKVNLASRNLLAIINDILNLSKIESSKIELESTRFDVNEIFERIVNVCMLNIEQKELEFVIKVDEDVPQKLTGDLVRLTQILTNLISNATKFTDYGEILLWVSVDDESDKDVYIKFAVKDTGIGIPQNRCADLFEAFTQVDTSTTRRYGGTGLGLSICKHLVQMMHGKIWVNSTEGSGSEFSFTIPFSKTQVEAPLMKGFTKYKNVNFYVLEKNALAQNTLCEYLRKICSNVYPIRSLEEFCKLHCGAKEMNYLFTNDIFTNELLLLKQLRRQTKIVLLSRYSEIPTNEVKSLVDATLSKPIFPKVLNKKLNKVAARGFSKTSRVERIAQNYKDLQERTILVVEDHKINQTVIKELLETQNLKVAIANNGVEALNLLKISLETEFSAVLMDLQMPEMGGMEAIHLLRKLDHCKQIPVIALTGDVMSNTKVSVLEAGFNDYLTKPVEVDDLFRILKKWIGYVAPATDNENFTPPELVALLSRLEGINVEMGLKRVAGNKVLYCKLLKQFVTRHAQLSLRLQELWNKKDVAQVKSLCHTVKGTAGNLGMENLYEKMNSLEKAIHLQTNTADSLLVEVNDEVCRVMEVLEGFTSFETGEYDVLPDVCKDKEKIHAMLKHLQTLLRDFDIDALSYFESNLSTFQIICDGKERELEKCLMEYDFEQATQILTRLEVSE